VGTGIGLLLAITGLQAMGIVTDDPGTLVSLGNVAGDPVAMLSTVGLFLTLGLYARGTRGSILIGVVATTGVGWGLTQAGVVGSGTLAPESIPSAQYNITPLVGAFIEGFTNVEAFVFALVVFTFFFVDFFDTAGTLVGVGQAGGFLDEDGDFPGIDKPLMADAVGTTVGGILGTSTVTTFIESATGIKEGGRTGLTALVVAVLFLCSLLVVPLAAAIPLYASHIALVVVAVLLIRNVVDIRWDDFAHAVPAGLTIMVIPFTYSIAYGIAAGIISYPVVKANQGKVSDIPVGQWILAASFVLYFVVRTSGVLMSV
jgi:AGZA family xanthine/uracil permease-like MFS transporter